MGEKEHLLYVLSSASFLRRAQPSALLISTHYPLPITHYPLPITHYPLPITPRLSLVNQRRDPQVNIDRDVFSPKEVS